MSVFSRNDENVQVPISFFEHVRDNGEQGFCDDINRLIGWSEFAELLTAYSRERYQRKEDAPLLSPTVFNGIRARENATITALIALDVEPLATNSEQLTFDEAKTFLQEQGLEGIVYTTASNTDGSRFRVVIPIAVPTDPQTHKRVIMALSKAIKPDPHVRWSPDPGKCNCYSLFYVPGTYQQACVDKERKLYQPARNDFHHNSGVVHDAATWLGVGEELGAYRKDQDIAESQLDYGSEANSFKDLESAIKTIVNDLERLDYIKVGAALRHELGDGGKPLFIEFARGWKNYNAADTAKDWDSFRHRSDCSAGTVYYWAKQADPTWEKPSRLKWRLDQARREATTWNSLADYLAERGERATGRTPSADWWTLWWDSYPGMDAEAFEAAIKGGSSDDVHHDPFDGTPSPDDHPNNAPSDAAAPLDIFGSLTPEAVLEPDMLPATIRDLAFDAADRVGITPATIAMAAIAVCAAALHGEIVIQPTEDWDWVEPPILWCMAVGDPGLTHTAALNAACRPLEAIDREWREADAEAITKYERAHAIYKEQIRLWDKAVAAGKVGAACTSSGGAASEGGEPIEPQEPPRRQLISTDYTMESLEEILAVNPRGILLKIDELAGFIGNFDAYRTGKSGKDRPLALKLWDGGRLAVDRVGRHTLVPNWAAGSVGKMQENKLASLAHILTDDGFMQRFLPYRVGVTGMGSHRPADREAIDRYDMLVRFLVNLEPSGRPITLSAGAQEYHGKSSASPSP